MEEMKRALDATDQFLDVALQDENRLRDPTFMMHLMEIRQKHKKTFAVIKEMYDLSSSKDATSANISHSFIGQQDSGLLLHLTDSKIHQNGAKNSWSDNDNRKQSHSLQSLIRTQKHSWCEEQKFEYTEKWIPKADVSATAIQGSYLRNKARKVPRSTYEPRYQQLCEKEEKVPSSNSCFPFQVIIEKKTKFWLAREARHQRAVEMLKKMRLSRVGTRFEPENFHLRRCISAEAPDWNKREVFKARDVPLSVYVSPYKDEIQACKRARRKTERAAQLIRTSRAPSGLELNNKCENITQYQCNKLIDYINASWIDGYRSTRRDQRYNITFDTENIALLGSQSIIIVILESYVNHILLRSFQIPNFKKLHEQLLDKLEKAAAKRPVTVVTPFYFQTDERTINHKCNHEIPLPKIHRRSHSMSNLREYNGPGIRLNHASLLRNEANRIRAQKLETEQNFSQKFWELMKKRGELARIKLKQRFSTEVTTVYDVQRRLKEKKTKEQERAVQYRNELEEMKRRVNTRALIVEQQEMLIKMQRFERKYKETIRAAKSNTRKVCIQREYSNSRKEEVITTSSDQQSMAISELNQDSNEMQTSKTETRSSSSYVSDSDGKDKESEHPNECDTDGDSSNDDIVDGDRYDDDESDDDEEDDDNEESENESNAIDDTSKFGTNSESSMCS
uniref:Uncharacterized protein n=1 Tax=Setaria digitata TaxID=48799 RepID=A0A915PJE5_9BILA